MYPYQIPGANSILLRAKTASQGLLDFFPHVTGHIYSLLFFRYLIEGFKPVIAGSRISLLCRPLIGWLLLTERRWNWVVALTWTMVNGVNLKQVTNVGVMKGATSCMGRRGSEFIIGTFQVLSSYVCLRSRNLRIYHQSNFRVWCIYMFSLTFTPPNDFLNLWIRKSFN